MKTFHLNLASKPYRDYRPFYGVVVAASLLIAFLTFNNVQTYLHYVSETQTTRTTIEDLERKTEVESKRAAAADSDLRNVNLGALDTETRFINARLAERAFSWSELLDRLEAVLPADVRIKSIAPTFDKSGLVHLELNCDAKDQNGMVNTINRFSADSHFSRPFPHGEQQSNPATVGFTLGVDYKPTIARVVEK